MFIQLIRVPYFFYTLRLMFSVIFKYCLSGSIMRAEVLLSMSVLYCFINLYQNILLL